MIFNGILFYLLFVITLFSIHSKISTNAQRNGEIRLTKGYSGLLEVYYDRWGAICDDGWTGKDSDTTCRILGYDTAISTLTNRYDSNTDYLLTNISCAGNESWILECKFDLFKNSIYISASDHVFIQCGPVDGNLRLTEGDEGLLEVYYSDWGFICGDQWSTMDAYTVCLLLGYGAELWFNKSSYNSSTNYKIHFVNCRGNEGNILECGYTVCPPNYCTAYQHITMGCGPAIGEIRLTGGYKGLLEVYYNGWGFICDDDWDKIDAITMCRIQGHKTALATSINIFNESTNYKLNFVKCQGNESSIFECDYKYYVPNYCSENDHIYIECGAGSIDVQLTESKNREQIDI